jgi:EipB-like
MRLRHLAITAILLLAFVAGAAAPAGAVDLAAHRALYALTLDSARSGDITGASGEMAYEVTDACDGWAVRQRLDMSITNRDGQDVQMVSDYTTWESKDGSKLRFRMKQTTDQAVTSEVAGDATLEHPGGPGTVTYTLPEGSTKPLPAGTLFPMAHTNAILDAAIAGKKFMTVPLFDGTGPNGAQDSSIAIPSWNPPQPNAWPVLAKLPSGRVRVAFFDRDANSQQPDYEVGMRYWQNGIADDLSMDFGEFVMSGKLKDLAVPPHAC